MSDTKVPLGTKLAYGIGAAAYGIKDNGFSVFLLLFYNQVVGLPAAMVGIVIAVALVFDALIDPLLGILSDRTKTRWGRRHPWLYASALPIALSWMLLWHPPQASQQFLLGWLFVTALFTRAAIATNEVPSLALAPELTRDYHERTLVLRYRYLFGWIGGLGFLMLAYGWFLVPPRGAQSGPLALQGFGDYGIAGAATMAAAVLISAIGTHRFVMRHGQPVVAVQSFAETMAALRQTLANRGFLVLLIGGVMTYTAQGVSFALSNYRLNFVWQLTPVQFLYYSVTLLTGVLFAFFLVGPLGRALGKVRAVVLLTIGAGVLVTAPYWLRLAGLLPPPGDPTLLPILFGFFIASTAVSVGGYIIGASMMSDVVEASEEHTGRREEGLFFAGALFMQKCSSGIGILVTGLILEAAQFPAAAVAGAVPEAVLDRLTLLFGLAYLGLALTAALIFSRFPFGRAEHEARLAKLAVAAGEAAE